MISMIKSGKAYYSPLQWERGMVCFVILRWNFHCYVVISMAYKTVRALEPLIL